jgi:spore maturation protein SpmB
MDNWIWGLSLITLTIAIHATGVTFMVSALHSFRVRLESRNLHLPQVTAIAIAAFTAMGLLLAVLHGIEAALWAAAYLGLGASDSPEAAIVYSVDSMATRGASGVMLRPHWQMMGALEGADGMLLFGISTAFIFTVMQFYLQRLVLQRPSGSIKAPISSAE